MHQRPEGLAALVGLVRLVRPAAAVERVRRRVTALPAWEVVREELGALVEAAVVEVAALGAPRLGSSGRAARPRASMAIPYRALPHLR